METQYEKQYEMLRNEILHIDTLHYNLIIAMYSSMVVIVGAIIASKEFLSIEYHALTYSIAYIILMPFSSKIARLKIGTDMISSYIRVFLEPHLEGIKWETHLFKMRKMRHKKIINFHYFTSVSNFSILITGVFVYVLFLTDVRNLADLWAIITVLIFNTSAILHLLLNYFKESRIDYVNTDYDEIWENLKNNS